MTDRPKLLVSVRNLDEAKAAVAGGADIIDIKEPDNGSLGKADDQVINEIVSDITDRPISAALGELHEKQSVHTPIDYVKIGLTNASCDWRDELANQFQGMKNAWAIAVAYADFDRVGAPTVQDVLDWAPVNAAGLLIDTAIKDGRGLFDWIDEFDLIRIIEETHASGLMVGLAGSLEGSDLIKAAALEPDIVAVRGAACSSGDRRSGIDSDRVTAIVRTLDKLLVHREAAT